MSSMVFIVVDFQLTGARGYLLKFAFIVVQLLSGVLLGAGERNPARDKVWVQGAGTQRHPDLRGFLGTAPPSAPRPLSFHLLMLGILLCSLETSLTLT